MLEQSQRAFRNFYNLFASGMSTAEIERLIKVDTRGMYEFYVRDMPKSAHAKNPWKRAFLFCKNLFLAFLLKLTPARRLLYALAGVLIIAGLWNRDLMLLFDAFLIMNFLLALELADKLITKDELAIAREIQLSLLPNHGLQAAGFEVAGFSDAARSVGGDYYDFIPLAGGSCLIVIGDVSGKGISAALYMAKVQTLLQTFARQTGDPRALLSLLNEHLLRELKRNYFLTLAIVRLEANGGAQLCRAGHTPVLLFERQRRECFWIKPQGLAIGLAANAHESPEAQNGMFLEHLEVVERSLQAGDIMLLFTDGVSETFNLAQQEFGEERLQRILARHHQEAPEAIRTALLRELAGFRRGAELRDDTTFVIIKRNA